jgi:hypothetical protein
MSFVENVMKLEIITLSEINQTRENKYLMFSHVEFGVGRGHESKKRGLLGMWKGK